MQDKIFDRLGHRSTSSQSCLSSCSVGVSPTAGFDKFAGLCGPQPASTLTWSGRWETQFKLCCWKRPLGERNRIRPLQNEREDFSQINGYSGNAIV